MKYGDIVVYKNQIGTVVKSENDFKFHPCNYGHCYFSELDTITDADARKYIISAFEMLLTKAESAIIKKHSAR